MVQLEILAGNKAGTSVVARRFPFQVGRSPESALPLDDHGVWDRHLTFNVHRGTAVTLSVQTEALATLNGTPTQTAVLKSGDLIEFGAAKLRFSLSPAPQRSQRWREIGLWAGLVVLVATQVAIILLLLT